MKHLPNNAKPILLPFFFFLLSFVLFSCSEPNNPPNNDPDTTSHDFTWIIDTLGTNGSVLRDVFVTNEKDIWAVGDIYFLDSTYNAVHYNGNAWEFIQFTYDNRPIIPIHGIQVFEGDDIWIAAGSVYHWNGSQTELSFLRDISTPELAIKFWKKDDNYLYALGNYGLLLYFDGQNWQRINSGTSIHFRDVWGDYNEEQNKYEILAIASNDPQSPQARQLFEIANFQVNPIASNNLPLSLRSIWFKSGVQYYLVGDGVFVKEPSDSTWFHDESHPLLYKESVRGNDINDVFIVGAYGLVSHFNGSTWKQYQGNELPEFYGTYGNLHFKDDFIVTVGRINNSAIILRGKRN